LWMIWQLLWRNRSRWQRGNRVDPELATFVQAAFLVLIIAGQLHSVMHMSYAQVLFFFLLGIVARGVTETAHAVSGQPRAAGSASAWQRPSVEGATGGEP